MQNVINMRWYYFFVGSVALCFLLLTACTVPDKQVIYAPEPAPEVAPEPEQVMLSEQEVRRLRLLADILYSAKQAFADNRLQLPAGNNAYDRYQEVLQLDPGNAVALEGIQEIALRYIELANAAMALGQYDNAESYLLRAMRINSSLPELADARARLEVARQNKIEVYNLDPAGLNSKSAELLSKLSEIAQHIQSLEATFIINARNDEEGRWIYKIMREAVGGYRLRGNIGIAGTASILVTVPQN
jgi:tetratricopeptide (TPR) repeat protein